MSILEGANTTFNVIAILATIGIFWTGIYVSKGQAELIAEANKRAADANERAENLQRENLLLQRVMRPRRLPGHSKGSVVSAKYEALEQFKGATAVVFVVPDFEAQTFARDLMTVLREAGWQTEVRVEPRVFDGVGVYAGETAGPGAPDTDLPGRAGEALTDLLNTMFKEMEIGAHTPLIRSPADVLLPESETFARSKDAIAVTIGLRPIAHELELIKRRIVNP